MLPRCAYQTCLLAIVVSVITDVPVHSQRCRPKTGLRNFVGYRNRSELVQWLSSEGLQVAAELGVQRGGFSEELLREIPSLTRLYLVDLWASQENYKDIANVDNAKHQELYQETLNRIKWAEDRTRVLRMTTSRAAHQIPDDSLDFVYVDARHDYCGALEDMQTYWPKLKVGGIMAGDDYLEAFEAQGQDWGLCGDGSRDERAVKGAVEDFVLQMGLDLHLTYQESRANWFFRKKCDAEAKAAAAYRHRVLA